MLIQSNEATEELNVSFHNFKQLIDTKNPTDKEKVVTQTALDCLEEIRRAQLGWEHSLKKFLATSFSYASALTAPFFALIGAIWFAFLNVSNLNLAISGSILSGVLATDLVLGKVFGIRPITACLIAAYDAYRQGAKNISRSIEKSYVDHEIAMTKLKEENRAFLLKELKETYLSIAKQLQFRTPDEMAALKKELPFIEKALLEIGLSQIEAHETLRSITETMKLLPRTAS